MRSLAIAGGGLAVVLAAGSLQPLSSDAIASVLGMGTLVIALAVVIAVGHYLDRGWASLACGAMGFLSPLLWSEGRWLAYLSGWDGLDMSRFLSALDEMPVDAGEAQGLALLLGGVVAVPASLCGAAIGWIAGRRPEPPVPAPGRLSSS
jgi:hypothetical protein